MQDLDPFDAITAGLRCFWDRILESALPVERHGMERLRLSRCRSHLPSPISSSWLPFNRRVRVEDKKVNAQAKAASVSLSIGNSMVAMPQVSSSDDSKQQIVESLLSEMHDLSFMLADHLVIPDRSRSQ